MNKSQRIWQIVGISTILMIVWLIVLSVSYSAFQNTRHTDALAEIHALYPYFHIVILAFAFLCIWVIWQKIDNKWLHVILLTKFALILWCTPYLLSGFVREPDGLWYSGISSYIQEVLSGVTLPFSLYAVKYPASFVLNGAALKVTNVSIPTYSCLVYPIFCTIAIILLWYVFAARFFDQRSAFLSTLIAIPALHYIKIHPSPQTLGTILVLSTLILLITHSTFKSRIAGTALLLVMFITHPISPVLTMIFIFAAYAPKFLLKNKFLTLKHKIIIIFGTIVVSGVLLYTTGFGNDIMNYLQRMTSSPFTQNFEIIEEFIIGTPFIYSRIYILNQLVYFSYFIAAIIILMCTIIPSLMLKKSIRVRLSDSIHKIGYKNAVVIITASLYITFTIVLVMLTRAFVLIERGLSFFILLISLYIASNIYSYESAHKKKKCKLNIMKYISVGGIACLLLVVITFPIISYSIDAYNSYPPSEESGLEFLSTSVFLENKTLYMGSPGQLNAYLSSNPHLTMKGMNSAKLDIVVFRQSAYYYYSLRMDCSFEDNTYTRFENAITHNITYDKIYSNPTFKIYISQNISI